MSWPGFLLFVLYAWTIVGALGVSFSLARREKSKALRDLGWIAAVWMIYLGVLIAISMLSRPRTVAMEQEQCFGKLCLTVVKAESTPSYLARHGEQDLRVSIRMTNRSGKRIQDRGLEAYLEDSRGRRWYEVPGLGGVRLSTTVGADEAIISTPVFRVASDATELQLVLNHGHSIAYLLRIGDRDSLLHAPVSTPLVISEEP